jgi:hypothetical protein
MTKIVTFDDFAVLPEPDAPIKVRPAQQERRMGRGEAVNAPVFGTGIPRFES